LLLHPQWSYISVDWAKPRKIHKHACMQGCECKLGQFGTAVPQQNHVPLP
jgi:hypothetical protein